MQVCTVFPAEPVRVNVSMFIQSFRAVDEEHQVSDRALVFAVVIKFTDKS